LKQTNRQNPALTAIRIRARIFDFANKLEREGSVDDIDKASPESFTWVDVDVADMQRAAESLASLGLGSTEVENALNKISDQGVRAHYRRSEDYLALTLVGCRIEEGTLALEPVVALMDEARLVTIHAGAVGFLNAMSEDVSDDFQRFAKGPSFLIYELGDHLIENFVAIQLSLQDDVENLQGEIIGRGDEGAFHRVAEVGAELLSFRRTLIPARDALAELAVRKSPFISEATRTFLATMAASVDRVISDVLVNRDLLSGSLNLHMSMITHRTNRIMNRLTVVNVIFLPLTFLCGVYGMNFEVMPELAWRWGYPAFWCLAGLVTVILVAIMRRSRLL
jgi:magnesium transporter